MHNKPKLSLHARDDVQEVLKLCFVAYLNNAIILNISLFVQICN
jgi:hypothetical protein